jgi:hypothetical protein
MGEDIMRKAPSPREQGVRWFDWAGFALCAAACFLLFCHSDIGITAQHSLEYLNGQFTDFYSACRATMGGYFANYMPTTFLAFAVWNLPLKLFELLPRYAGDWSVGFLMWNRLLSVGAYLLSGWQMLRICRDRLGMGMGQARLGAFLFLTAPAAFYSQFLFGQYDSFTVLFVLVGLHSCLKEDMEAGDWRRAALWFGLAASFKYYAILLFAVVLLLRVKDLGRVFRYAAVSAVPVALAAAFYLITDRDAFVSGVLNFTMLGAPSGMEWAVGPVNIQPSIVVWCFLLAFAFFCQPRSPREMIGYALYFCSGVCATLFTVMRWNPQWVMLAVPFWTLGAMVSKRRDVFLWLDVLFAVVFVVFVVNRWPDNVDQEVLRNGILMPLLRTRVQAPVTMRQLFHFTKVDSLYSVLTAVIWVLFFFRHPRYNLEDFSAAPVRPVRAPATLRFLAIVLLFTAAALACVPAWLQADRVLWRQGEATDVLRLAATAEQGGIVQTVTLPDGVVRGAVFTASGAPGGVRVEMVDGETGAVLARAEAGAADAAGVTSVRFDRPVDVRSGAPYAVRFLVDAPDAAVLCGDGEISQISYRGVEQVPAGPTRLICAGEEVENGHVALTLTGDVSG